MSVQLTEQFRLNYRLRLNYGRLNAIIFSKIARGRSFDAGMGNAWIEARSATEETIVSTGPTSLKCAPAPNT